MVAGLEGGKGVVDLAGAFCAFAGAATRFSLITVSSIAVGELTFFKPDKFW